MKNLYLRKLLTLFLFIFFCAGALVIPFKVWEELQIFSQFDIGLTIISERGFIPPVIFALPLCLIIALGLFIRLVSLPLTSEQLNKGIKFIIRTSPPFVLSLIIYPLAVNNYIKDKGYIYCSSYTNSRILSADVWLSDPSYCISKGSAVRYDIVQWMLQEQSSGRTFTPEKIEAKIDEFTYQFYNP